MDLWIRSQDKTDLVCTKRIYVKDNTIRTNVYETIGFTILGEYETKERALEVLDEIQNILQPKAIVKAIDTNVKIDDDLVYRPQQNTEIIPLSNAIVYEMPKE